MPDPISGYTGPVDGAGNPTSFNATAAGRVTDRGKIADQLMYNGDPARQNQYGFDPEAHELINAVNFQVDPRDWNAISKAADPIAELRKQTQAALSSPDYYKAYAQMDAKSGVNTYADTKSFDASNALTAQKFGGNYDPSMRGGITWDDNLKIGGLPGGGTGTVGASGGAVGNANVTPGGTTRTASSSGQASPNVVTGKGLISGADSLSSLVTVPLANSGAGGLLTSSMLTAPQPATVVAPAGAPTTPGWNFGATAPTPGVDTWVNQATGQRLTYAAGTYNPGAGWVKA